MQKSIVLSPSSTLKHYWALSKPGIILGNLFTAVSGFALASQTAISIFTLTAMLLGLTLVMASACALNNCIDRSLDGQMLRTQKRPLVTGAISLRQALIFAGLCGCLGLYILYFFASPLSATAALFGTLTYVLVYSFSKYHTPWCTLLGSFAGASPILVGYLTLHPTIDTRGWLLFSTIFCWQMPHFYAIAMFRLKDYAQANIPVLPAVKGIQRAKKETLFFTVLYFCSILALSSLKTLHLSVAIMLSFMAMSWIILAWRGFYAMNDRLWAKKMFFFSLTVISFQSLLLML